MKAIWYDATGPAAQVLRYGDLPEPAPGPGEVRVQIYSSGVNKADTKMRAGADGQSMPFPRVIPHQDGSGVIDDVGLGVSRARLGERVWLFEAQIGRPFGTAAEYVVVPERNAIHLPSATTFSEGACLGIPAITAHRCLFQDGSIRGQTVLVTGAAGGVGYYAIQLAKWAGARVVAAVAEKDADAVRDAGADHVVRRGELIIDDVGRALGADHQVDRIVDVAFGPNLRTNIELLRQGGTLSTYASDAEHEPRLPFYPLSRKNPTVHFVFVFAMPAEAHTAAAQDIVSVLERRVLKHRIGLHAPLEDCARAHEATESGIDGRAIVDVRGPE